MLRKRRLLAKAPASLLCHMTTEIKLGLIGKGISNSRMPRLQQHLANLAGIELSYALIDSASISSFDLREQVITAKTLGFTGVNVTHPFKQNICGWVDRPTVPGHARIGAYNTLLFGDDEILGANTDYSGFISGYRFRRGHQNPGRVFLCGAGGAGHAIAWALTELGCEHLHVYDVLPRQADSLADELSQVMSVSVVSEHELEETIRECDGLINATSLGMHGHPGSAITLSFISAQSWAFDAVYTPLKTEFLLACEHAGIDCLSGFNLWLFQGLDAFQLFTGHEVKADPILIQTALSWL